MRNMSTYVLHPLKYTHFKCVILLFELAKHKQALLSLLHYEHAGQPAGNLRSNV